MIQLSDEQNMAVNTLQKNNLIIDSVAGCGKTTTCLHMALKYNTKRILLLTYNARLKDETRLRASQLGITNLETHSYHAFCVKYYSKIAYRDHAIRDLINSKNAALKDIVFDIIIVDEAQDMTELYYKLIKKIYQDNLYAALICILGDQRQCIYQFQSADFRFITRANKVFNWNNMKWKNCKITTSYRITNQIANLLNNCMYTEPIINAQKEGSRPEYIICNTFKPYIIFDRICKFIRAGYDAGDIFVLAYSVRKKITSEHDKPTAVLENLIKKKLGIPIYAPTSDDETLNDQVVAGKLVFSSFHQAKGLERKICIIYNFDDSLFKYYMKDHPDGVCPNVLYVAATRASEHLILVHHYESNYLPFLNQSKLSQFCNTINDSHIQPKYKLQKEVPIWVTDFIRNINQNVVKKCISEIDIITHREPDALINVPTLITQNTTESVAEINGTAIPLYYEYKLKKSNSFLFDISQKYLEKTNAPLAEYMVRADESDDSDTECDFVDEDEISMSTCLKLTTQWLSDECGYKFKTMQIHTYDWLSDSVVHQAVKNLEQLKISPNAIFEKGIGTSFVCNGRTIKLVGRIDCEDGDRIFEFKVVKEFELEHYLQLITYMFINETVKREQFIACPQQYYLYNILTNELIEIKCEYDKLKKIIESTKYILDTVSDREFIEKYGR